MLLFLPVRVDEKQLRGVFKKAKRMLSSGILKNRKAIVEQYVKQVIVYKYRIEAEYLV